MSVKMADRNTVKVGAGSKPVPMKLFSTWELEKTSHNCVPRLCSLTLSRLVVLKSLEADLTSVYIAAKMQYPHYLKHDGNKLQIMLQRRKKYKNRTILGYKTLAIGQVSMSQVLQRAMDKDLHLYNELKERSHLLARIKVVSLSSQPADHFENGHHKALHSSDVERSPDVDNDSDDEDVVENYDSSNEEMSDGENINIRKPGRMPVRSFMFRQKNFKQKFTALLKRFKLSEEVLDSEPDHELVDVENPEDIEELFDELENLSDSDPDVDQMSIISTPRPSLRPFFTPRQNTESFDSFKESVKQLEDTGRRSDSDSHVDTLAPQSNVHLSVNTVEDPMSKRGGDPPLATPENSESNLEVKLSETAAKNKTDSPKLKNSEFLKHFVRERSTSFREKGKTTQAVERHASMGNAERSPRKALLEQLKLVLGEQEERLPEIIIFVNTAEWQGQYLVQKLQDKQVQLVCTLSMADSKACINSLVTRLQKFCNSNSQTPKPIKVGMAGGDAYFNAFLRLYVDYFSTRSPEWHTFIKFLAIPIGTSNIAKYLSSVDPSYCTLFSDVLWKDTFDKLESTKLDAEELYNRISTYVTSAHSLTQIPIAQAMVTYKTKSSEEDSSQIFLPFMSEVKIGSPEHFSTSVEVDDPPLPQHAPTTSSPPQPTPTPVDKVKDNQHTPPNSPNVGTPNPLVSQASSEFLDLQVEFWTSGPKLDTTDKERDKERDKNRKESTKCSLKSAFRYLHVSHLPPSSDGSMAMTILTREKKQKIMRLGKKSKDGESKRETIEGISRLICSSKSHNNRLTLSVDGHDWSGVRFFQLSPQWQTHIKHFPIVVFGTADTPC